MSIVLASLFVGGGLSSSVVIFLIWVAWMFTADEGRTRPVVVPAYLGASTMITGEIQMVRDDS